MSSDEARKGIMGLCDNPHAISKATEVYETYMSPGGDYFVHPAPAHATMVAQRLDNLRFILALSVNTSASRTAR